MKRKLSTSILGKCLLTALSLSLTIVSCKKNDPVISLPPVGPEQEFYVLSGNSLKRFNAKSLTTELSSVNITGVATSETLLSIDFRPATGELYAVSNASKFYVINATTGAARAVSTTAFTPALSGTDVSLDFNPTVDRIRIVTNTGQNLRLHPETGAMVMVDGNINGVTNSSISGVGYTNSFAGAANTTLYDVDLTTKKLYKQDLPNAGTLVEVGALGVDLGTKVSMDVSPDNKNILIASASATATTLYSIDLATGKATLAGNFPSGVLVKGLAIATPPAAYAVDNTNNFLIFNPRTTAAPISKAIIGLQAGETVLGMDMRPVNGQIYALGSTSRLYAVNASSGAFTQVGTLPFATLLAGTSFGFDFNPSVDRIRIVSNTGQNLRIDPNTGLIGAVDSPLNPGTPAVSAAAYTNNFSPTTTTKLFVIDHNTDKLYSQDANAGTLTEVGNLMVNVEASNGFDIISSSGGDTGYAILTVAGVNKLYQINLTTGAATAVSDFSKTVTAFTLGLRF
ncbi:DUF4394 domain-containing protein [Pedobacter namyangjuensis]|uniref:DUF4394 domain-containing protein n=1 Tax=Pedobacter namyangjuensis TaxID=600626 RepID=UPI000DE40160|nr:DUF4394 domain-containing protein [Pedobacter namyangjuensis]